MADGRSIPTRLHAWQQDLQSLVPEDAGDGVVVLRPELVSALLRDLATAAAALASHELLFDAVDGNVHQLSGSVHAMRQIHEALDAVEAARE